MKNDNENKKKIFLGSSQEAFDSGVIKQLKTQLENKLQSFEIEIWLYSAWNNGYTAIQNLSKNIYQYEYAIFVGYPDDICHKSMADDKQKRYVKKCYTTRDNVILEMGLFMSRIGIEKTFFVLPNLKYSKLPESHRLPFSTPSDFGGTFLSSYNLEYQGKHDTQYSNIHWKAKGYKFTQLILQIKKDQEKINTQLTKPRQTIDAIKKRWDSDLGLKEEDEEFYILKFYDQIIDILKFKSALLARPIVEIIKDILQFIIDIDNVLDVKELAKEQHTRNDICEVWIFSQKPLEFEDYDNPMFEELRSSIINNLRNGVSYYYFVSKSITKEKIVDFITSKEEDTNVVKKMLGNIHMYVMDDTCFFTDITLHFKNKKKQILSDIYLSIRLPERKDLLIKTDTALKVDIYEKLKLLKGNSSVDDYPRVFDRCFR